MDSGDLALFGLLGLLGVMVAARLWQAHKQKRRLLSTHELNLRRATRPLGVVAVLAFFGWFFGASAAGDALAALAPVVRDPSANWLPAVLLGALLLYGLASFLTGARRCWGVRGDDGMLPVWAFYKLAFGVGGIVLLMSDSVLRITAPNFYTACGWMLLAVAAVWCAAVGAARFVLLTTGGGNALGRIIQHIHQTRVVMRPARPRPWWKFW